MILIIGLQPDAADGRSKWTKLYNAQANDWQVLQTLFFCQFLYGLCSVTFIPFTIPLLQAVLTHSSPTAYNDQGQCTRFVGPAKEDDESFKDKHVPKKDEKARDGEHEGVLTNFKNIAMGK